jgi:hypothetical protein
MFLVTMVFVAIPVQGTQPEIVIGVVGPKGWIQWDGLWEGTQLAVSHIGGSITIGGTAYTIRLVDIDSHAVPTPDPAAGIAEMLGALAAEPNMRYMIGGFRTECVAPMEEALMDYAAANDRPIWYICGAATDSLVSVVLDDYDRYKYMFRNTPMSSTALFTQIVTFMRGNMLPQIVEATMGLVGMFPQEWNGFIPGYPAESFTGPGRLARMYGNTSKTTLPGVPLPAAADGCLGGVNVYVMADALAWCEDMVRICVGNSVYPTLADGSPNPYASPPSPAAALGPYCTVVGHERPSAVETDFTQEIANAEAAGAHLILPIFSAVAGASFSQFYGTLKPDAVAFGINVESQSAEYWITTSGLCEYECGLMTIGTRSQINPYPNVVTGKTTQDIYDDYVAAYGHGPIYTMWGAYDAIIAMAEPTGLPSLGSFPAGSAPLIALAESTLRAGAVGYFKYTDGPGGAGKGHDLYVSVYASTPFNPPAGAGLPGWVRAYIPQWRSPGSLEVIWPRAYGPAGPNLPYAVGTKLPYWMYSLAETDLSVEGTIDATDLGIVGQFWQAAPQWYLLETDIDDTGFVDILDIARVAKDFGSSVTFPL